jgi:hypothetical protein
MNAWVLALMALLGSLGLAQKPLKTLAWGSYSLRIEENEGGQVARILLAGRTLVEVRDFLLEVSLVEVTGRPPKELLLTGYSGGAHCCTTHYLFTQEGGLRNLLYQEWGDGGIQEVRDLDGDGRGELIALWVYAYFGDLSFAYSPGVYRVYAYDGMAFHEVTRKFPVPALQAMRAYREDFLNARSSGDLLGMRGSALGYWLNALVIGQGAEAKRWLMESAPPEVRSWLLQHEEEILNSVSALPRSYSRALPPKR